MEKDKSNPEFNAVIDSTSIGSEILENLKQTIITSEVDGLLVQLLIVMVVLEHVILLVKTYMHKLIGDKPLWVKKCQVKIMNDIENLNLEETN
jgi:ATP/ADP translocase